MKPDELPDNNPRPGERRKMYGKEYQLVSTRLETSSASPMQALILVYVEAPDE